MNVEAMIAGPPHSVGYLLATRHFRFVFSLYKQHSRFDIMCSVNSASECTFSNTYNAINEFDLDETNHENSLCERSGEERTSATSSKSEKYKMCQYLFRLQFGKENTKDGKENEILKTL